MEIRHFTENGGDFPTGLFHLRKPTAVCLLSLATTDQIYKAITKRIGKSESSNRTALQQKLSGKREPMETPPQPTTPLGGGPAKRDWDHSLSRAERERQRIPVIHNPHQVDLWGANIHVARATTIVT